MVYEITDRCIGCTLCAKNCPVHAVNGTVKQTHKINPGRCVGCGVCANVCPKGAIQADNGTVAEKVPRERWKKPEIDVSLCSACSMCVDICTFSCLAISYPAFKGDLKVFAQMENEKKCVGCGLCASVCPLRAIVMKGGKVN